MKEKVLHSDLRYIHDALQGEPPELAGSTILITGHAGFLGYYLTMYLLEYAEELNLQIIAVDNFALRIPSWQVHLDRNPRCKVYTMRVEDINAESIPNIDDVNYIFHMASIASPVYYRRFPLETFLANVQGLERFGNMYMEGQLPNLKRMVVLSSSEIYGNPDPENIPTAEDYAGRVSCTGPRACYDEAKRVCETLCWIYANHYQMPVSTVRPFNIYGPGMSIDDKRLPADLASSVLANRDIEIYSDGAPTRTFCYIADAVVGMLKVLCYHGNEAFNIGNSTPEISVMQLAQMYRDVGSLLFGYTGEVVRKTHEDPQYLTNNPQRRCPDITKAVTLLNYQPQISLDEGIRRYLQYLKG